MDVLETDVAILGSCHSHGTGQKIDAFYRDIGNGLFLVNAVINGLCQDDGLVWVVSVVTGLISISAPNTIPESPDSSP